MRFVRGVDFVTFCPILSHFVQLCDKFVTIVWGIKVFCHISYTFGVFVMTKCCHILHFWYFCYDKLICHIFWILSQFLQICGFCYDKLICHIFEFCHIWTRFVTYFVTFTSKMWQMGQNLSYVMTKMESMHATSMYKNVYFMQKMYKMTNLSHFCPILSLFLSHVTKLGVFLTP